jgi:type IV pilus assembly protein PilY1
MNQSRRTRAPQRRRFWQRMLPIAVTCGATLLSLPIHAVTIPALPLQSGSAYPPPNIMFILDDSGSMENDYMPDGLSSGDFNRKNPTRNTIYYNPLVVYRPWIKADDSRFTGGMSMDNVYSHDSLLSGSTNLFNNVQTYFVPKGSTLTAVKAVTKTATETSFWRFQILPDGRIFRAEWLSAGSANAITTVTPVNQSGLSRGTSGFTYYQVDVPYGATDLVAKTSGGTGNADLYIRAGANPTTSNSDCASATNNSNTETCTISSPSVGAYYVGVRANNSYSGATLTVTYKDPGNCATSNSGTDWRNCTRITPSQYNISTPFAEIAGRSEADELLNYATWYSYHRTRIKVAKAGASEAFSELGGTVRVGYDSIWNRAPNETDTTVANNATPVLPIATGTDDGAFTGTNRSNWYDYLQAANGGNGTPLKGALQRSGRYFESAAPWGPGTGADQISCRQNFAILTTDGYWNDNTGYSAVGDTDSTTTGDTTIISPDHKVNPDYTYVVENPFRDPAASSARSDTLADVAMRYWKRDLRTTLENNVPKSFADKAFWQHMVTFGVSIGLQGNLNPKTDLGGLTNGSLSWPNPNDAEDADRIDDLWHASVNGHGNFVAASNPTEFAQGLVDALATVAERLASASNVTANSTSFTTDTRVYQASYVSGSWIGELAAYNATSAGVSTTPVWKASSRIPVRNADGTGRKILTWNGTAGATFPTAAQIAALPRTTGLAVVDGADNANYIAGVTAKERRFVNGTLRNRSVLLGDIANSSPMYSKDIDTIFVGANDGMLHAIRASDAGSGGPLGGTERFAYVPGGINLADLSTLSDPQYTHKYFVDGPIAVSTRIQTPAHNYLVGALGRGGKGVYGLEVTSPDTFSASDVLWERTSGANMGYVLGQPLVVTLNDGSKGVIVSNGINSASGHAVLFVLNLTTGAILAEIDTGVGGDNGLSAPRGWDQDGNGTVDLVFAGDLKGNVWKFDLTNTARSQWGVAYGTTANPAPMFTAMDAGGKAQPITAGVALAKEPLTGQLWVLVGTGSFLSTGDVTNVDVQSMYGLIDNGQITSRSQLQERQILVLSTDQNLRSFEASSDLAAGKKGWFIDLDDPAPGERIISDPRVRGSVLVTSSIVPPEASTCDAGGSGYVNAVNAFTGTSLTNSYFDTNNNGNFNDDKLTTNDGQEVPVGSVNIGVGMPTLPTVIDNLLVVGGSTGSLGSISINPQGGLARRVSWREIIKD